MLTAKSKTQNMTMTILRRRRGWVRESDLRRQATSVGGHREARGLEQPASGTCADEAIDVKRAECEYEGVDRAEDHERDRGFAFGQEWRHGIRGSQDSVDRPRLTADFSGEPAGKDRNEG